MRSYPTVLVDVFYSYCVLVQNVYNCECYRFDCVVCIYFCACTYKGTYICSYVYNIFINEALQPVNCVTWCSSPTVSITIFISLVQ